MRGKGKMTSIGKKELTEVISESTGYSKKEISSIIDAFVSTTIETLAKGESVALIGFGSFAPVKRAARIGINPAKGTKMEIPARVVPKFKAGKAFRDAVK